MSYEDIGLNSQLQPINSPIEKYGTSLVTSLDFDNNYGAAVVTTSNIQGSAVTDEKMGTFSADKITAGTIDATAIAVTNIDAGNIVSGTISSDRIGANSITSGKISVGTLSAISANMGTVTAGKISGLEITGGTITGSKFRTASSGVRVEIVENDAKIYLYDAGNDQVFLIDDNGTSIGLATGDGRDLVIASDDDAVLGADDIVLISAGSEIDMDNTLDMNNNQIKAVEALLFQETDTRPTDSDAIWYYKSGGSYQFRTRMEGTNWSIDQTSV